MSRREGEGPPVQAGAGATTRPEFYARFRRDMGAVPAIAYLHSHHSDISWLGIAGVAVVLLIVVVVLLSQE